MNRVEGVVHKKQRIPSYCDRVLWKSMAPLASLVAQTSLSSVEAVSTSDHKPVVATFDVMPSTTVSAAHAFSGASTRRSSSLPLIRVTGLEVQVRDVQPGPPRVTTSRHDLFCNRLV